VPPGFYWHWLEAARLPMWTPPTRGLPSGEQEYTDNLAEKPADSTLAALLPTFERLI
jgi:hypothetical protein